MFGKRYIAAAAIAVALSVTVHVRDARTAQANLEYEVKAAFLYNFAKFVEWPDTAFAGPDAPIVFCIVRTPQRFRRRCAILPPLTKRRSVC